MAMKRFLVKGKGVENLKKKALAISGIPHKEANVTALISTFILKQSEVKDGRRYVR